MYVVTQVLYIPAIFYLILRKCIAISEVTLTPVLQVLLALWFYATGTFQDVIGELIGISQVTASRPITRVTDVLVRHVSEWVKMPTRREANITKWKFFSDARRTQCHWVH